MYRTFSFINHFELLAIELQYYQNRNSIGYIYNTMTFGFNYRSFKRF